MKTVYKIGWFGQTIEEKEPGVQKTSTTNFNFLPNDFATKKEAETFMIEKGKASLQDEWNRYFMVLKMLKKDAKKLESNPA